MPLDLSGLEKAVNSLQESLAVLNDRRFFSGLTEAQQNTIRAGVIQNFEFTYESCWKFLKRWLEINVGRVYVEGVTRRELFRLAVEYRLIDSVESWMEYHRARNLTSHVYDSNTADDVLCVTHAFEKDAAHLATILKTKNA